MAQSKAQLGIRTLFQIVWGSPATYTTIKEMRVVTNFGVDRPEEEVTHFESPDDSIERIPGLKDGKQFTLEGNLTEDNREMIEEIVNSGTVHEFKQIIPAPLSQTRYFSAAATGYTEGPYTPQSPNAIQIQMRMNRPPSATPPDASPA